MQINELASLDKIQSVANNLGLSYNNDNIKVDCKFNYDKVSFGIPLGYDMFSFSIDQAKHLLKIDSFADLF